MRHSYDRSVADLSCRKDALNVPQWSDGPQSRETRFVPMQAKVGDYALFFRKAAVEITFEGERFLVVPQAAILALVRDEDFDIDSL